MNVSEKLRELRKKSGMTQEQVAQKIGVTRQTISSYESGRTEPGLDILKELSRVYGVEISELLIDNDQLDRTVDYDWNQMKSKWAANMIKRATRISVIGFLSTVLLRSMIQWGMNAFIPIGVENIDIRTKFWILRDVCGAFGGILLLCCCVILMILEFTYREKKLEYNKVKWAGSLILGTVLITLPFGLTDRIYKYADYILTPGTYLITGIALVAAGWIASRITNLRKNRSKTV